MASIKQQLSQFRQWQRDSSRHIALPSDKEHHCPCCDTDFTGNFCPQCGQKADVGRISWNTVRQSFSMLWGMDSRSLPYTLWQLLLRPGYLIGDYISGKRQVSFPPVKMLALVAVVVLLVSNVMDPTEEGYENLPNYFISNYLFAFFDRHYDMAVLFFFSFLIIPTYFIFRFSPRHPRHNMPEGFFIEVFNSTIALLVLLVVTVLWNLVTDTEDIEDDGIILLLLAMLVVYRSYHQLFGYGHWATLWRTTAVFLTGGLSMAAIIITDNIVTLAIGGNGDLAWRKFAHGFVPFLLGTVVTIAACYYISRRTHGDRSRGSRS